MAARRTARPVPGRRIPAALFGARLQARTRPRDLAAIASMPPTGTLEELARHRRHVLVTFRRDGTPVPTPVWAAAGGGRLYVRSERDSGKVRRLRRDPRALLAPCDPRGNPRGAPLEVTGRMLDGSEAETLAEQVLAARYGLLRAAFEVTVDALRVDMGYLELTPQS